MHVISAALFKWLEQKHHGVKWPRVLVSLTAAHAAAYNAAPVGNGRICHPFRGCEARLHLSEKLIQRMDTSSGLYQMFGFLSDLIILPQRQTDGSERRFAYQIAVPWVLS